MNDKFYEVVNISDDTEDDEYEQGLSFSEVKIRLFEVK